MAAAADLSADGALSVEPTQVVRTPRPANERARIEALRLYDILDTPPEQAFDDIAALAAHICGVPVSSIAMIDTDRAWFKAKVGIDACENDRDAGFCTYTILQDGLLVVPDTTADERFADLAIVRGGPEIRFYAGAPLVAPSGHRIGALAVYDGVARDLTDAQREALLALSRQAVDQLELRRALARSRQDALTDALTGLGNRRSLLVDLESELSRVTTPAALTLTFLDLDGFKLYNDIYGHVAGDSLLTRLAAKLSTTVAGHGTAYRMGGDEFCVLLTGELGGDRPSSEALAQALSERGEGFSITSSQGSAVLPLEAADVSEALNLADERMYRQKNGRPGSVAAQTAGVVGQILSEGTPELHKHVVGVTTLVRKLGTRMKLTTAEIDELVHAAELHDVGKMAIPHAILTKPGPLNDDERSFMERHTVIGERMLGAAPALKQVAHVVRSSHERWDGAGYPDGLRGEEIPLAARIVFICDSFDAMTSERPYRAAMTAEAALADIREHAGTQFDPTLVEIFCDEDDPFILDD